MAEGPRYKASLLLIVLVLLSFGIQDDSDDPIADIPDPSPSIVRAV